MRKILTIAFVCLIGLTVTAQIKIHRSDTLQALNVKVARYDSTDLSNFQTERFIGQRVITYQRNGSPLYVKDPTGFDGKRVIDVPLFTYFEYLGYNKQEVTLRNEATGEICYYYHTGDGIKPVMAIGYIEKVTRDRLNSLWFVKDRDGVYQVVDVWLKEGGIAQKLQCKDNGDEFDCSSLIGCTRLDPFLKYIEAFKGKSMLLNSAFEQGAVSSIEVRKGKPYLIFLSQSGKKYSYNLMPPKECYGENGLYMGNLPRFTAEDHARNIKKYGKINWVNIVDGVIKLGMTQEMVRLAYGDPDKIISVYDTTGNAVNWDYGSKLILFINGKVKQITDI